MAAETIEKTVIRIEADAKNALAEIKRVKEEIGGVDDGAGKAASGAGKSSALMTAAWAAVAAAVVAATAAVAAFTISSAKAASEVEQYMVSLGFLYKSEQAAGEQMKWIFDFARSTPFEVAGLVDATVKLKAFGLEAQDVLEVIGDTAAATSKPIDQVVNAYGRLSVGDTGKAIAMFRDIGVNLKNIEELEFDANGALVTPIEQAMPLVKMYLEDQFGGLMEAQSHTAKGIGSNIKDAMYQAGLAFAGFEQETVKFREGSLFLEMKDGLQGVLDVLNRINFEAIGEGVTRYLKTSMGQIDDFRRGLDGIDLSGFIGMLKLFAAAWWGVFQLIDKYNICEYLGKAARIYINAASDYLNFFVDSFVIAMNTMIDIYNTMVHVLEKAGMEVEYIQHVSMDKNLSRFFKEAEQSAEDATTAIEGATAATQAASSAASSAKIPGWAGQSDYIRERLKEIGGKNIDDMLAAGGMPSGIGGSQTIGGVMQANVSASVNAPMVSLVDINRTGFDNLSAKLDGVIRAVQNISIRTGSSGSSSGKSSSVSTDRPTTVAEALAKYNMSGYYKSVIGI